MYFTDPRPLMMTFNRLLPDNLIFNINRFAEPPSIPPTNVQLTWLNNDKTAPLRFRPLS